MTRPTSMRLNVLTPSDLVIDEQVIKIIAEGTNGSFALLPRHVDFVAPLSAGVLAYTTRAGDEYFLGVDEGILVKCADNVRVSTRRAAKATSLALLRDHIVTEFEAYDEQKAAARMALAHLELELIRRFVELGHQS
ncbi:MAG: F0F1 ATP synthase subunit epsilon [Marinicaulis sp.]|nr:F0F1 ATP synthase subunit epsilon [Marinicaulis sp.]